MSFGEMTPSVRTPIAAPAHPSAPIPVQGAPLGRLVRVPLGETGLTVHPLILGTAEFGWHVDMRAAHSILDAYRARGGNVIHTSDSYSSGRAEHIIGQWMSTRDVRDEMVIGVRVGTHPEHPGLGSINLIRAVEGSLTRLGTDYLDILYLDGSQDSATSLEDTLATAEWLVETGKIRALGCYGFSPAQLVEARILSAAGYPRLSVLDVPHNVLRPSFTGDIKLVAGAQGIAVTPSQALEHGFLAGVYRQRADIGKSVRATQIAAHMNRRGSRTLRALDRIAEELSISTGAVAVAWALAQRGITAPIVSVFAVEHVEKLMPAVGVHLSRAHLADIARAVS